MDESVIVPLVETSETPKLEDTTLYKITPSTFQQSPTLLEIPENIATSCEETVIQLTQQLSLNTVSTSL
ncbi:2814_t:CDS:1, partial [Paraglomus occultum]